MSANGVADDVANGMTTRQDLIRRAGLRHECTGMCDERAGTVRVLLCEEHDLLRHGLRLLLAGTPDIRVCRDVASLSELDGTSGSPDVVVHGLVFEDVEGPAVVRALRERFPEAALLVVSRLENPLYVHLCLTAGARGYLVKRASPEELVAAVRTVASGEEYVQPTLGAALARWRDFPRRQRPESLVALTEREREVLELLAAGHTNAEAATSLGIALRTVEAHRAHIFQKLGFRRRAELVRYAAEHRLG